MSDPARTLADAERPTHLSLAPPPGPRRILKQLLAFALAPLPRPQAPLHARPGLHLGWRYGWLKGWAVRPMWKLRELLGGPRVRVGKRFCLRGKLTMKGPGQVIFGDDVIVDGHATPYTHGRQAVIRIGDRVFVNGTRFGCAHSIHVGADTLLSDARIMDNDFHALSKRRSVDHTLPVASAPVRVGVNAWVGAGSWVLKGVTIG